MALMPVPATCADTPMLSMVEASALACSAVKPNCFAVPPMRVNTSTILDSVAAVVLPRVLIASPSASTCSIGKPKMFVNLATACPASSAVMPKAVDILAARSTKVSSFSIGTPS